MLCVEAEVAKRERQHAREGGRGVKVKREEEEWGRKPQVGCYL
jgi:hypothetical protein